MMRTITLFMTVFLGLCLGQLNAQHTSKGNSTKEPIYSVSTASGSSSGVSMSSTTIGNEECYCYFYNDFDDYLGYIAIVNALGNSQRQQWYNDQKELLKDEIEDRLNSQFTSFETAQHDFFKQKFANAYAANKLDAALSTDANAKGNSKKLYDKSYVPTKIFQYARSNSQYDFEGLSHGYRLIESMSYNYATLLYNQYLNEINIERNNWKYHNDRIIKNNWVRDNGVFSDFVAQQYIDHVNGRSLEDRVALMTGYLIYNWQSQPLVYLPPTTFQGVPFYYPYNYDYNGSMNTMINNAPVSGGNIPVPSLSFDELKRKYSMMGMYIGNKAAGFYEGKTELAEEAGKFQGNYGYNGNSKNLVKRLAEYFEDEEPFMPSGYWRGTQTWGQDDDRPEHLLNIRLSSWAQNWYIGDFAKTMQTLGQYQELDAAKGGLIREYFDGITWLDFADGFTDLELGRIFDFDWRGRTYLGLQFSPYANDRILDIEHGDNQYGWDLYRDPFKVEALKAIANGGVVDFKKEIIKDKSFIGTKADCILEELLNQTGYFREVMNAFTNNNSKYRIKFTTGPVIDGADAQTSPPDENGIVTITFRPSSANGKVLEVAGVLLHEGAHAQLHRIIASGNRVEYNISSNDYNWLLDLNEWWMGRSIMPAQTAQHDFMSLRYVNPIANAVRKYDEYQHQMNNYMYFGWEGLYDEGSNRGLITRAQFDNFTNLAQIPLNDNHKAPCE